MKCILRVFTWLFVVAVVSLAAAHQASAFDVFEVKDVEVDITAKNADAARNQAVTDGELIAFRRLLKRMTLHMDWDKLPELGPDGIRTIIRDFSVTQEKTSSVRYIGKLSFRFKSKEVRALLTSYGIQYTQTPSKPVLILPVYQVAGSYLLWDEPNPWRAAWSDRPVIDGLVPTVLPLGDLSDIAAIGSEQAVIGDVERLSAIASRYGANDALVGLAVLEGEAGSGFQELKVRINRYGGNVEYPRVDASYVLQLDETEADLLKRAAFDLTLQIEDTWKQANLISSSEKGVLVVSVPVAGLGDWIGVRKALKDVAIVQKAEIALMSRKEVRVKLHYTGTAGQLAVALEQVNLTLIQDADVWILAKSGNVASKQIP